MNYQTLEDIKNDAAYVEGFNRAEKLAAKKYEKLFNASKAWFEIYESAFGTPDENSTPEYWTLRKLLKLPD